MSGTNPVSSGHTPASVVAGILRLRGKLTRNRLRDSSQIERVVGLDPIDAVTRLADQIEVVSINEQHSLGQPVMRLGDQVFREERGKRQDNGSMAAFAGQLEYAQGNESGWRA